MSEFLSSETNPERVAESTGCHKFFVVGIGASAGGLESIESLFSELPADTGMAFVVVQHLSPDFKSHMQELLARRTSMQVHRVENGMTIEPNCVYLIPPRMEMVVSQGTLLLTEKSLDRTVSHPIDVFFRSLAADRGRCAVGVVLSGTGTDGTRGVREIHQAGGLVIAQDERTAKFDGMPLSAQSTGVVDLVLPPEEIAEALVDYSREGRLDEALRARAIGEVNRQGLDQVFHLLHEAHGIDFSGYKVTTVGRRIERRMHVTGCKDLKEYISRMENDRGETDELYKDLLIGVTRFFRDQEAFDVLDQEVIAKLVAEKRRGDVIRVWVAGCASGEEAYSLAILFDERIRASGQAIDVKIFATDAHHGSLASAARGIFSEEALEHVSEQRRRRYFHHRSDGFHVTRELRGYVIFAPHDVTSDAPFTQMDLVTCRNLLIYLQTPSQKKALGLFHFALKAGGVLFLGPSETPGEIDVEFEPISKRWRLYRKRRDVRLPLEARLPTAASPYAVPNAALSAPLRRDRRADQNLLSLYNTLLDRYMPPSLLVNSRLELEHTFAGAERFLKLRSGRASQALVDLIDEQLRTSLLGALRHAIKSEQPVRYTGIRHGSDGEVCLVVEPLGRETNERAYLISFESHQPVATKFPDGADVNVADATQQQVRTLESELRFTQENLQATIEELETSNEELQAANEELIASNEELQSTNEELHSVNEELYTVNAENQKRVEELATAYDDMDNLLATTRVGVIFLDEDLHLRRFTPEIARLFHLLPQDVGRSVVGFQHTFQYPSLIEDLKATIESKLEREIEVQTTDGNWYLLRMLPYRMQSNIGGVVIALIDIDHLRRAESELRLLCRAINVATNGIVIADATQPECPLVFVNTGFEQLTGYTAQEAIGQNCRFLQGPETDADAVRSIREAIQSSRHCRVTLLNYRKDGGKFWNDLQITPLMDAQGRTQNFIGIQHDVTARVAAEREIAQSERSYRATFENAAVGIAHIDRDGRWLRANGRLAEIVRCSAEELLSQSVLDRAHPEDRDWIRSNLDQLFHADRGRCSFEHRYLTSGDDVVWVSFTASLCDLSEADSALAIVIVQDITERKEIEQKLSLAKRWADSANRAKSSFLANMSHELRTPLTAMLGFAEILREELSEESQLQKLETIRSNGQYLLRLLNDVLDLSKIEARQLDLPIESCELVEFLRELEALMQVRADQIGTLLEFHIDGEIPQRIETSETRLRQVLVNLIGNALKFTEEGKVTVSSGLVWLADVPWLQIKVSDTGIGMNEAQLKRLFKPFTQVDHKIAQQYGGTGLGLSISKRLVTALGGTILVESEPNVGTSFTVRVPVGEIEDVPRVSGIAPSLPIPTKGEQAYPELRARVLVVDDRRDVWQVAKHFLSKCGASVTVAEDGRQAIDATIAAADDGTPYDLILIDMQMPVMGGIDAVRHLRSQGFTMPIIALTADAMKGEREKCIEAGCNDYLTKPIDAHVLTQAVARQLSGSSIASS